MRNLIIVGMAISLLAVSCTKSAVNFANTTTPISDETPTSTNSQMSSVGLPLERALELITKKPFGLYVDTNHSPVSPEKFRGYHTATDFEILEGETDKDIPVMGICDGKLLQKRTATGYGGLIVQACTINDQAVTVIYGHVRLPSVAADVGEELKRGQVLGLLGNAYSTETSGERKHLHLGIHKGTSVDIRGYVQNKSELDNWINFETLLK